MDRKSPKRGREEGEGEKTKGGRKRLDLDWRGRGEIGEGKGKEREGEKEGRGGKEESERGKRGRLGRRRQPSSKLRARNAGRGAEARHGRRAEEGAEEGTRGLGERSLEAKRRHGAAPAGGAAARFLPPPPAPAVPPARRGPPRAPPGPGGLRAPPSSARPRPPSGCLPGPEPVRGGFALDSPALPPAGSWGEWGFREREGERADDAQVGKDRWMSVSLEARCWGKRSEGTRVTRGHGLSCQRQTREPLPHHTCAPLWSLRAQPLGPHSLPPPFHSPRKARFSGSRGAWGLRRCGGGKGQPCLPEDRGETLRGARLRCLALSVLCLHWGRPGSAALCPRGPPFQQQPGALGKDCGS